MDKLVIFTILLFISPKGIVSPSSGSLNFSSTVFIFIFFNRRPKEKGIKLYDNSSSNLIQISFIFISKLFII